MTRRELLALAGLAVVRAALPFAALGRVELDARIAPLLTGRFGTYEGFSGLIETPPAGPPPELTVAMIRELHDHLRRTYPMPDPKPTFVRLRPGHPPEWL